jgi:murein DD-endopeptidase MepM/ murein hydrolase activator NlpD
MATAQARTSRSSTKRPPCRILLVYRGTVRDIPVRPWLAGPVILASVLFALAYFAATGYLVFRDDLLAASFARQARMKQAYEDRIAALRADIDRLASRQLINQEAFEARLAELRGRQELLDERQDVLAGLSQTMKGARLPGPSTDAAPPPAADDELTTGSIESEPVASAALAFAGWDAPPRPAPEPDGTAGLEAVAASLDSLAGRQIAYVEDVLASVTERSDRIAAVLARMGQGIPEPAGDEAPMGGPFIELDEEAGPEAFRLSVALVEAEIERLEALRKAAGRLPIGRPISDAVVTSRYGPRIDPFLRRRAMHSGIDFKTPTGQPARATAAGTVIAAGYTRGYGYLVEIDHGGGLTTRYAHLSRLLVKKGARIDKGALIGRTGSTGRSTGPHLHYEVRVKGRAVDPMTFISAGIELAPLL